MKRIITYSIIALLQASVSLAKNSSKPKLQKREKYEWQGEIPTYVETQKKELTYPMILYVIILFILLSCFVRNLSSCL